MIKKSVKKLIVFILCAIFVLPCINFNKNTAKASSEPLMVFKGTEYSINLGDDLKSSVNTNITITVNGEVIYEAGSSESHKDYLVNVSTVDSNKYANITFFKNGDYTVNVKDTSAPDKVKDATIKVGDTLEYITLKYKDFVGAEDDVIKSYKEKVAQNASGTLIAGESSFTVPEIGSLIDTNFPYGSVRKTVYYYASGETSSKNTYASKADLKFSISSYGTYRFYVLANIEKSNQNIDGGVSITVDGLKEEKEGFYKYYNTSNQELYYNKGNNKFYIADKNSDDGYSGDAVKDEDIDESKKKLIVPIFEFTVQSQRPTIKIDSSYQENGYVGLKYKVTGVTINGDVTSKKYELLYSTEKSLDKNYDNFTVAEEEFNASDFTFTPTKMGYYVVRVTAYSVNSDPVKSFTPQIEVKEKYEQVKYKVSFSDWLNVNVVPFILFCISGACLVTIILLITIKPKEKKASKIEEDR